jgi:Xaa-Pro aminopeptidase
MVFNVTVAQAQEHYTPKILNMQSRAEVQDNWLSQRLETVLPKLMRRENIDMWVIIAREYNEGPVIETMLPATWPSARRRTIIVFYDSGEKVERLLLSRPAQDIRQFYEPVWDYAGEITQWERLAELIKERNPDKIALNYSETYGQADGITMNEFNEFKSAIPSTYQDRIVSGENLAVGWLETRTEAEMAVYQNIVAIAQDIIAEGFSEGAIQPGVTTTQDVVWWYRQKIRDLNLTTWFQPSVSIEREGEIESGQPYGPRVAHTIKLGDMLHVDFGISYLGLQTDTQELAYVLKPGESDAPEELKEALNTGNRLQDILTNNFETGRTGNEILKASREQAISEGITPSIYTHPIGYYGHGAGVTIGLGEQQGGVKGGKGDYPMYPNTAYSIELNAKVNIPEWNKTIPIKLEQDAFFDGDSVRYINGRQTELYLIPRQNR